MGLAIVNQAHSAMKNPSHARYHVLYPTEETPNLPGDQKHRSVLSQLQMLSETHDFQCEKVATSGNPASKSAMTSSRLWPIEMVSVWAGAAAAPEPAPAALCAGASAGASIFTHHAIVLPSDLLRSPALEKVQ